jgi:hypothetical protein
VVEEHKLLELDLVLLLQLAVLVAVEMVNQILLVLLEILHPHHLVKVTLVEMVLEQQITEAAVAVVVLVLSVVMEVYLHLLPEEMVEMVGMEPHHQLVEVQLPMPEVVVVVHLLVELLEQVVLEVEALVL